MKRRVRFLIFAGLTALLGLGVWCYAQERHDLPPFDPAKAEKLAPSTRSEYERLLFNEIPNFNAGTLRHNIWSREEEWLRMASEGFELADLTLRVLSPTRGSRFSLRGPLKRLAELAEGGDAAAMCLYRELVTWGQADQADFERYNAQATEYMERGAALGHPECLATKGAILLRARNASKEDKTKGFAMLVTAAKAGYAGGAYGLVGYFIDRNIVLPMTGTIISTYTDIPAIVRYYCWDDVIDSAYQRPFNNINVKYADLDYFAEQHKRDDLKVLSTQLKQRKFDLDTCIQLGLED